MLQREEAVDCIFASNATSKPVEAEPWPIHRYHSHRASPHNRESELWQPIPTCLSQQPKSHLHLPAPSQHAAVGQAQLPLPPSTAPRHTEHPQQSSPGQNQQAFSSQAHLHRTNAVLAAPASQLHRLQSQPQLQGKRSQGIQPRHRKADARGLHFQHLAEQQQAALRRVRGGAGPEDQLQEHRHQRQPGPFGAG